MIIGEAGHVTRQSRRHLSHVAADLRRMRSDRVSRKMRSRRRRGGDGTFARVPVRSICPSPAVADICP